MLSVYLFKAKGLRPIVLWTGTGIRGTIMGIEGW